MEYILIVLLIGFLLVLIAVILEEKESFNDMGFGSSAKKNVSQKINPSGEKKPNIFLDTKSGIREFRIVPPGDEVRFKVLFFARESDGAWVPTFTYVKNDPREKKPVVTALFDPFDGDEDEHGSPRGKWEYGGEYADDPIRAYVDSLDISDKEKQGMYAREKFQIVVLDRTRVKIDNNGNVHYPDSKNKYLAGLESIIPVRLNQIKILQGSSGKVRDENDEIVGKHMYAGLLRCTEGQLDVEGRPRRPSDYDLRLLITGKENETVYTFSATGNDDVIDWSIYKTFDLRNWQRLWPHEAVRRLMDDGAEYNEVMQEYGLKLYPDAIDIEEDPF